MNENNNPLTATTQLRECITSTCSSPTQGKVLL